MSFFNQALAMSVASATGNEETRKKQSGARNGMVMRKGEIYGG